LFPLGRAPTIAAESRVFEGGVQLSEDLGDEHRVISRGPLSVIANSLWVCRPLAQPRRGSGKRIAARDDEDGYGALGMVRHIKQGAVDVRAQPRGSVPTLDLPHFPAQYRGQRPRRFK